MDTIYNLSVTFFVFLTVKHNRKNFSRKHFGIFPLFFFQKTGLIFHANCLQTLFSGENVSSAKLTAKFEAYFEPISFSVLK